MLFWANVVIEEWTFLDIAAPPLQIIITSHAYSCRLLGVPSVPMIMKWTHFHEWSLMMVGSGVVRHFFLNGDHEHSDKCLFPLLSLSFSLLALLPAMALVPLLIFSGSMHLQYHHTFPFLLTTRRIPLETWFHDAMPIEEKKRNEKQLTFFYKFHKIRVF